jgi:hypothetical protein
MPVVMGLPEPDVCAKMLGLAGATLIFTMATTGHVAARLMPGGGGGLAAIADPAAARAAAAAVAAQGSVRATGSLAVLGCAVSAGLLWLPAHARLSGGGWPD